MSDPNPATERCVRCGKPLGGEEGFRAAGAGEAERAAFCRLEHVVPWVLRGAPWDPLGAAPQPRVTPPPTECSECGGELADPPPLVLVRHRDGHRVPDGFCSTEHLRAWAIAGGRWRPGAG